MQEAEKQRARDTQKKERETEKIERRGKETDKHTKRGKGRKRQREWRKVLSYCKLSFLSCSDLQSTAVCHFDEVQFLQFATVSWAWQKSKMFLLCVDIQLFQQYLLRRL